MTVRRGLWDAGIDGLRGLATGGGANVAPRRREEYRVVVRHPDIPGDLGDIVGRLFDETVDTRRQLHAEPELAFGEVKTTQLVRERCRALGFKELACPTPTGAIFELDTGRPGKSVALRADMDALPVFEEVDVAYRSRHDGVMHACGHDGHVAMVLAAAEALSQRMDDVSGRLVLIFQPAEENGQGARAMIDGGALEVIAADHLLSVHLSAPFACGQISVRPGLAQAHADSLHIEISGSGGHVASPREGGRVIEAAAELLARLPEVVAGMRFDSTPCVCNPSVVHAGTTNNVVPRVAHIQGSLRTFTHEQRLRALESLRELLDDIARGHAVKTRLGTPDQVPAVDNDRGMCQALMSSARAVLGEDKVTVAPAITPCDDIAHFLVHIPGCHFFVGARPEGGLADHHAPDFYIDERALQTGTLVLARATMDLLRARV